MRLAFTGTPIRVYCRFSEVYYTPEGMDTRGIQGTPTPVQEQLDALVATGAKPLPQPRLPPYRAVGRPGRGGGAFIGPPAWGPTVPV